MRRFMTLGLALCLPLLLMFGLAEAMNSAEFSPTLSDEFDDASTFSDWQTLSTNSTTAITIDIDTSTDGALVMVPSNIRHTGETSNNGWFANGRGPYLYKLIEGDFIVTSRIIARNVGDLGSSPTGSYNSAGFVARDPASAVNDENWLMYNHGYQTGGTGLATEGKTTVDSNSVLTLRPTNGSNQGRLTLCRSGDTFYMFKWMDNESDWSLEHTYERPDLPDTLQVGPVVNGWTSPDLYAEFEYLRFYTGTVASSADCTENITVPTQVGLGESSAETKNMFLFQILLFLAVISALPLWKRVPN